MKALVVYGSKRGGTQGLAEMVGTALTENGHTVTVRPAAERAADIDTFDVVIVGGALYATRWHKDARKFVRRNTDVLKTKPVWFFSSGPIGEQAAEMHDIPPVGQVRKLMDRVGARGHTTFGGRLSPDAQGFPARAMAEKMAGDWRDEETVKLWVKELISELG